MEEQDAALPFRVWVRAPEARRRHLAFCSACSMAWRFCVATDALLSPRS